jgi:hypothetical protein
MIKSKPTQHPHAIPKLPVKNKLTDIGKLVLKSAMEIKIERAEEKVPIEDELDALFEVIDECSFLSTPLPDSEEESEKKVNYDEFLRIKTTLESVPHSLTKFSHFFKPSLFLHFSMDKDGRISAQQFYNFILRKISLDQARIDLAKYDGDCDGYLTESDLQSYLSGTYHTSNTQT